MSSNNESKNELKNEPKKPSSNKEQGKTVLQYLTAGANMEWFAFAGSIGLVLAVIFLVYGVLGTDHPKWLGLLMVPLAIYTIYFFAKLMFRMGKVGSDGKKLNMFWKFWRLLKQVFFSPISLVLLYAVSLSVLGSQISYLDKQLIYDNGGKLWTAVSAFHIATTCFYLYVLSSWDGLQDLLENKSKTLEWVQTRKINLVGMMTALLVIVSALTVFFYIEIVTKPVIG